MADGRTTSNPAADHEVRIHTHTAGGDRRVRAVCSCGWKSEWETLTTAAQRAADEHLKAEKRA